jgi:hypothetical protein
MATEFPYTTKPEDAAQLLEMLPGLEVPTGQIDVSYISKLGFTPTSSKYLFKILKMLGFLNEDDTASATWKEYVTREQRGLTLAAAIKNAYAELFENIFCPYLEDDQAILDFMKQHIKASGRDLNLMLQTFRYLSESADFQDIMCESGSSVPPEPASEEEAVPKIKVNPNLQLNIQIHINPATPDEKIEVIFKNMRKYLLGKGD